MHGIFSLTSNIPYFEWMLRSFRTGESPKGRFSFRFQLEPRLRVSTKNKERINIMFYHNSADNSIEIDYPWFRPICAKLSFDEDERKYTFAFNKNYLRVCQLIGGGWRPISILRTLLQMNLIRNNMLMLHGGVVRIGNEGILMPSVENKCKTKTVWMLAKRGA